GCLDPREEAYRPAWHFLRDSLDMEETDAPLEGLPVVFYVRDNGIGIPEEHFETVFRIFTRLHGRGEFGDGAGAGLTIARQIVERDGGTIWVGSAAVGVGTTLFFPLSWKAARGD